jgi:signal transduction histidine kinase
MCPRMSGSLRHHPCPEVAGTDLSASPVLGHRVLLERLAFNLVDNAVRYDITRGTVGVATGVDGNASYLTVTNTGDQLAEAAVGSLGEPFARLGDSTSDGQGVGLGPSIVKAIAAAHGVHLTIQPGVAGGLRVDIRFPFPDPVP